MPCIRNCIWSKIYCTLLESGDRTITFPLHRTFLFESQLLFVLTYSREFTHRVKSISMAKFTSQEVIALQEGGNQVHMSNVL